MDTRLTVVVLAIAGIFCMYRFGKQWNITRRKNQALTATDNKYSLTEELPQEEAWWSLLDTPVQLELAVVLAQKALPVWQRYSETNELVYKNSPIGTVVKIRISLLQSSLDEVVKAKASGDRFPQYNSGLINSYNEFVAPLVALQDGNWAITYPVKKIFLAVYNILKGIAEQEDITVMKNLFALSINQSLDCLDMCKLYSRDEIKYFLQSYRIQSA